MNQELSVVRTLSEESVKQLDYVDAISAEGIKYRSQITPYIVLLAGVELHGIQPIIAEDILYEPSKTMNQLVEAPLLDVCYGTSKNQSAINLFVSVSTDNQEAVGQERLHLAKRVSCITRGPIKRPAPTVKIGSVSSVTDAEQAKEIILKTVPHAVTFDSAQIINHRNLNLGIIRPLRVPVVPTAFYRSIAVSKR